MPSARVDDRADAGSGRPRHEPARAARACRVVERLEVEGEEVAPAGAPVGPSLEQLRPGQRDDEDRDVAAPLEQVVDEVEQARVGPVEVLEDEDDRAVVGDALEERPPRREQLLASAGGRIADAEQGEERRLDPAGSSSSGTKRSTVARDLRAGGRLVVGLEQAGPRADHLAERPERDALAVGRRAALVPVDGLDDAVDVLQELPGEAALADAGRPGDRHEPRAALAGGRVEQVLEQPQLVVAADERRLEAVARVRGRRARRRPEPRATPATGAALPLRTCSPAGSKAIALLAARWVASPTSTVPGGAADWSREAVLTRSPATMPWPSRRASPPPRRSGRRRAPGGRGRAPWTASTSSSAARTARSASSSWAIGAPHTAITASPMNFSTCRRSARSTSRASSK